MTFKPFHKRSKIIRNAGVFRLRTINEMNGSRQGTERIKVSTLILGEYHMTFELTSVDHVKSFSPEAEFVIQITKTRPQQPIVQAFWQGNFYFALNRSQI
ncbi:MAG: hypothetical protein V4772_26030 [Pseudomonadota bacterium]